MKSTAQKRGLNRLSISLRSGHNPRVLGSSPTWSPTSGPTLGPHSAGSPLLPLSVPLSLLVVLLSLSQTNKILKNCKHLGRQGGSVS